MRSILLLGALIGCGASAQPADVVQELAVPMPALCAESVRQLRLSFDGRRVVYGCRGPGPGTSLRLAELEDQLFVVDTATGATEVLELPALWITFDLSFDGRRLAILEREPECVREPCVYTLRVLEAPSWAVLLELPVPELESIQIRGDGERVELWDAAHVSVSVEDGTFVRSSLSGVVAVSEDGGRLVRAEGGLTFLDIESGEETRFEFAPFEEELATGLATPAVTRDGRFAYVAVEGPEREDAFGRRFPTSDWWLLGADGSAVDVPEGRLVAPDRGVILLADSTPGTWLLWTPERTEVLDVSWWPTRISRDGTVLAGFEGDVLRAVVTHR